MDDPWYYPDRDDEESGEGEEAPFSQWCKDGNRHDWSCEDIEVWGSLATSMCRKCGLTVKSMTGEVLARGE
jgi:hypothetical protein